MLGLGISAFMATTMANLANNVSMDNWMQNWLPNILVTGRNMQADQRLQRRYYEIDMKLQRQSLHREDIRDLMELTVGRMDIFHVVGTLLLSFCITWFTDSQVLESDLPRWFITLFLISNFTAVGYLLFSVWLAMHASIAAQSVGVRLLTSFARLSIPSRADLEKLTVSIVPYMEQFLQLGRQIGLLKSTDDAGSKEHERAAAAASPASTIAALTTPAAASTRSAVFRRQKTHLSMLHRASSEAPSAGTGGVSWRLGARQGSLTDIAGSAASSHAIGAGGGDVDTGEDDQQHFRRFLEEQTRWVSYDAYARVCMSLGVNQMLQALSYYVVGLVAARNVWAGLAVFLAVNSLSILLLQLDVGTTDQPYSRREAAMVLFFTFVPTAFSAGVLWLLRPLHVSEQARELLVTPCFAVHALWLVYITCEVQPDSYAPRFLGERPAEARIASLPRRFRAVGYLNVVQYEQHRLAEECRRDEATSCIAQLRAARQDLEDKVRQAMADEAICQTVSVHGRGNGEAHRARVWLADRLEAVRESDVVANDRTAETEVLLAEQALDKFEVWVQAPEILATLEALRAQEVQGWLKPEERSIVESSYQAFLRKCLELDLGVCQPMATATAAADGGEPVAKGQPAPDAEKPLQAMYLTSERPAVRVDADILTGYLPHSVWIDTETDELKHEPPVCPTTSFRQAVTSDMPRWTTEALRVREGEARARQAEALLGNNGCAHGGSANGNASGQNISERGSQARRPSLALPRPERPLMPAEALPPDDLPSKTVRRFSLGSAFWWIITGFTHFLSALWPSLQDPTLADRSGLKLTPAALQPVAASWPEPAGFFEVNMIRCNSSWALFEDSYSRYRAPRLAADRLGELVRVEEEEKEEEGAWHQGLLSLPRPGSSDWRLAPLELEGPAATVPVPPSWSLLSAAWACPAGPCSSLRVAGWDGADVAAVLLGYGKAEGWRVMRHFRVPLERAGPPSCGGPVAAALAAALGSDRCRGAVPDPLSRLTAPSAPPRRRRGPAPAPAAAAGPVRTLQLGHGGSTLAVLLGDDDAAADSGEERQWLEGWDLARGAWLGRWRLGSEGRYTAMCHDGREVLLVRQRPGNEGPLLEAGLLPAPLTQAAGFPPTAPPAPALVPPPTRKSGFLEA